MPNNFLDSYECPPHNLATALFMSDTPTYFDHAHHVIQNRGVETINRSEKYTLTTTVAKLHGLYRGVLNRGILYRGVLNRGVLYRGVLNRGVLNRGVLYRGVLNRGVLN